MRAAVVEAFGAGFSVAEVDLADPIGSEVLVEVKASGLCHTDLTAANVDIGYPVPSLLGHEIAGVVAALGPGVTDFSVGDHVVGCLIQYCGECPRCLAGRAYQCLRPGSTLRRPDQPPRVSRNRAVVNQAFGLGGFAQRALIHERQLVKVDDRVPFPQAALLGCGVITGAGAVLNSADLAAGDSVVIIGAGGVGLNAISGALVAGATTIVAVDISDVKLEKASAFGATHTVNSTTTHPVRAVREITGGGAEAVFDFVGLPEVSAQALKMVATGGGLYLIGGSNPEHGFELRNLLTIGSQKRVQGVVMGSSIPRRDIPMYADLYLSGRFKLDELISTEIALSEVNAGYAALHDAGTTRVVITDFN